MVKDKSEQPSIFDVAPTPVVDENPYFTPDTTREDKQMNAADAAARTEEDRTAAAKLRRAMAEQGLVSRSEADPRIVRTDR